MAKVVKKWWRPWIPRPLREYLRKSELERELTALNDDFNTRFKDVRNKGEEQDLINEWDRNTRWQEAELGRIKTEKLVRRAERRCIDLYAKKDWWTDDGYSETRFRYLTDSGLIQAKCLIRADRLENFYKVSMLLIALGGIIVAILNSK